MRIWTRACGFAILYFLSIGTTSMVWAVSGQPGTLDASWASASPIGPGKVITQVGGGADVAKASALQPDGKVLIAGYCTGLSNNDFCALRYNVDGTPDNTFGTDGKVISPVANRDDLAAAIALQPDGRAVLAGQCKVEGSINVFCALRYNHDGTLDTSFGSGGTLTSSVSGSVSAVAVQADGKLVFAGECSGSNGNSHFCALRYHANGSIDVNFGAAGKATSTIGSSGSFSTALALQADGKLLLAGQCLGPTSNSASCLLRYDANGAIDVTFGAGGLVVNDQNSIFYTNALVLQPDGRVTLAGTCFGNTPDFCAQRYNANGTLDTTFGTAGKATTAVGGVDDYATAIALQPDAKLVVAGNCTGVNNRDFCAVRYHSDGTLDMAFGNGGKVITPVGTGDDSVVAVLVQPDGKLALVGNCTPYASFYDFCAVRYDGGPFGYKACSLDIDGDNRVLAMTDSLIHARIALGLTGTAVVNGITFPTTATRNTWPLIRDYLVTQCGMSLVQ